MGQARPRRARHGFGVVMLLRAAPASGRGREGERLGAASAMVAALPISLVEPVTSAVLPFRSVMALFDLLGRFKMANTSKQCGQG